MADRGDIKAEASPGRQRPDGDVVARRARRLQNSVVFDWMLIGFGALALAIGHFTVEARTRFDRLFAVPSSGSDR
jgi:hypothetical protein